MNKKYRFVTLYIRNDDVDVHIQRIGLLGQQQVNRYTLHRGDPSIDRLWDILKHRDHTHYPAQKGWGVTLANGRGHSVYKI